MPMPIFVLEVGGVTSKVTSMKTVTSMENKEKNLVPLQHSSPGSNQLA